MGKNKTPDICGMNGKVCAPKDYLECSPTMSDLTKFPHQPKTKAELDAFVKKTHDDYGVCRDNKSGTFWLFNGFKSSSFAKAQPQAPATTPGQPKIVPPKPVVKKPAPAPVAPPAKETAPKPQHDSVLPWPGGFKLPDLPPGVAPSTDKPAPAPSPFVAPKVTPVPAAKPEAEKVQPGSPLQWPENFKLPDLPPGVAPAPVTLPAPAAKPPVKQPVEPVPMPEPQPGWQFKPPVGPAPMPEVAPEPPAEVPLVPLVPPVFEQPTPVEPPAEVPLVPLVPPVFEQPASVEPPPVEIVPPAVEAVPPPSVEEEGEPAEMDFTKPEPDADMAEGEAAAEGEGFPMPPLVVPPPPPPSEEGFFDNLGAGDWALLGVMGAAGLGILTAVGLLVKRMVDARAAEKAEAARKYINIPDRMTPQHREAAERMGRMIYFHEQIKDVPSYFKLTNVKKMYILQMAAAGERHIDHAAGFSMDLHEPSVMIELEGFKTEPREYVTSKNGEEIRFLARPQIAEQEIMKLAIEYASLIESVETLPLETRNAHILDKGLDADTVARRLVMEKYLTGEKAWSAQIVEDFEYRGKGVGIEAHYPKGLINLSLMEIDSLSDPLPDLRPTPVPEAPPPLPPTPPPLPSTPPPPKEVELGKTHSPEIEVKLAEAKMAAFDMIGAEDAGKYIKTPWKAVILSESPQFRLHSGKVVSLAALPIALDVEVADFAKENNGAHPPWMEPKEVEVGKAHSAEIEVRLAEIRLEVDQSIGVETAAKYKEALYKAVILTESPQFRLHSGKVVSLEALPAELESEFNEYVRKEGAPPPWMKPDVAVELEVEGLHSPKVEAKLADAKKRAFDAIGAEEARKYTETPWKAVILRGFKTPVFKLHSGQVFGLDNLPLALEVEATNFAGRNGGALPPWMKPEAAPPASVEAEIGLEHSPEIEAKLTEAKRLAFDTMGPEEAKKYTSTPWKAVILTESGVAPRFRLYNGRVVGLAALTVALDVEAMNFAADHKGALPPWMRPQGQMPPLAPKHATPPPPAPKPATPPPLPPAAVQKVATPPPLPPAAEQKVATPPPLPSVALAPLQTPLAKPGIWETMKAGLAKVLPSSVSKFLFSGAEAIPAPVVTPKQSPVGTPSPPPPPPPGGSVRPKNMPPVPGGPGATVDGKPHQFVTGKNGEYELEPVAETGKPGGPPPLPGQGAKPPKLPDQADPENQDFYDRMTLPPGAKWELNSGNAEMDQLWRGVEALPFFEELETIARNELRSQALEIVQELLLVKFDLGGDLTQGDVKEFLAKSWGFEVESMIGKGSPKSREKEGMEAKGAKDAERKGKKGGPKDLAKVAKKGK